MNIITRLNAHMTRSEKDYIAYSQAWQRQRNIAFDPTSEEGLVFEVNCFLALHPDIDTAPVKVGEFDRQTLVDLACALDDMTPNEQIWWWP